MADPQVISLDNLEETTFAEKPSVNFGGGIELLMNDKKKTASEAKSDIGLDDIITLEDELKNIDTNDDFKMGGSSLPGTLPNIDNVTMNIENEKDTMPSVSNLGASTLNNKSNAETNNSTWDGFSKKQTVMQ